MADGKRKDVKISDKVKVVTFEDGKPPQAVNVPEQRRAYETTITEQEQKRRSTGNHVRKLPELDMERCNTRLTPILQREAERQAHAKQLEDQSRKNRPRRP
eukprot:scpid103199/ scgid20074/ 